MPVKRKTDTTKSRRREARPADTPAPESGELLSRAALATRLEAQRTDLLRAMSCVGLAQRTIDEHLANPKPGGAAPVSAREAELHRQRVLDALQDAGEALRMAYPMLERIAQALAVDEILKQQTQEPPQTPERPVTPAARRSSVQS